MNLIRLFAFFSIGFFSKISVASLADHKIQAEPKKIYLELSKPIFVPDAPDCVKHSIKLLAQSQEEPIQIGHANFFYTLEPNAKKMQIYLSSLVIDNPKYKGQSLGSYLFKYTIATIKKTLNATGIYWLACPLDNKSLEQFIQFYADSGAQEINSGYINMHYPIRRAEMLATLLPIIQPYPIGKKDRQIMIKDKSYTTSPHDPLGIIANYMEPNEINQSK